MSCGGGCRRSSDPALLWLWCRPAATAAAGPLAWEPLYAMGAALKSNQKKKKRNALEIFTNSSLKVMHETKALTHSTIS